MDAVTSPLVTIHKSKQSTVKANEISKIVRIKLNNDKLHTTCYHNSLVSITINK